MVWLSAHSSNNHSWMGHKEVARGEVFGNWKRFTYYCNGHQQYIYCRTAKVFLILFAGWISQASINRKMPDNIPVTAEQWEGIKYAYTLESLEGVDISTENIIMDNPDSRPFRVKSLIRTQHGEYIQ